MQDSVPDDLCKPPATTPAKAEYGVMRAFAAESSGGSSDLFGAASGGEPDGVGRAPAWEARWRENPVVTIRAHRLIGRQMSLVIAIGRRDPGVFVRHAA